MLPYGMVYKHEQYILATGSTNFHHMSISQDSKEGFQATNWKKIQFMELPKDYVQKT